MDEGSPFRESAEPWVEPKPDPLEEMRRDRNRVNRRRALVLGVPVCAAVFVLCTFIAWTNILGIADGVRVGMKQPAVIGGCILGDLALIYLGWRTLSRPWLAAWLGVAIAVAGMWVRSYVTDVREKRTQKAIAACDQKLGAGASSDDIAACVPETVRCIARLDSAIGDDAFVVYLGDPCAVQDPRDR